MKKGENIIKKVAHDINVIKIQGATNIAISGIDSIFKAISISSFENEEDFFEFIEFAIKEIKNARPTEPMLFNGLKYLLYNLHKNKNKNLNFLIKISLKSLSDYLEMIKNTAQKAVLNGIKIAKKNDIFFTHCHSGSVIKTLDLINKKNKIKVFHTETRPLFQGRLTAADLKKHKIDATMIVDSEASYFISDASGEEYHIDKVLIGCDAIGMSGSIINKVGSYGIALAAKTFNKPLYISGNLLKCDATDEIPVEQRSFKELWENVPSGIKILNFAFDLVPTKYIAGIITEFGIIEPKNIRRIVKEKYPWMFEKI